MALKSNTLPGGMEMAKRTVSLSEQEKEVLLQAAEERGAGAMEKRLLRRKLGIESPTLPRELGQGYRRRETSTTPEQRLVLRDAQAAREARDYQPFLEFGKALRPYRRHLRKVTPKGIWFNTRFGVKKLRVNRVGMYIKASRKNFYLHKW